ncbi:hypothetical protein ACIQGO_33680 [Streptomyces shenzhenensis]|uniref:SLAC1 family transporter n=1 Tax=Streptomyces shenzhenensis TaxID=943815 RepID=UPI0037F94D67
MAAENTGRRRGGLPPLPTVGFGHFGISLGLSGLAGTWSVARTALGTSPWVANVLWSSAAGTWLVLLALYGIGRRGRLSRLASELRHPVSGTSAALIPLVGSLLATHHALDMPVVARCAAGAFAGISLVIAVYLLSRWFTGEAGIAAVHPGYMVPTVAAPFVSSSALGSVGEHFAAEILFGVALVAWGFIGAVVVCRLLLGDRLPTPLVPTLAILLAPPAVGGICWMNLNGDEPDPLAQTLVGVTVAMALVQVSLLGTYRRLPVSIAFWTFTFPVCSAVAFLLRWGAAEPFNGFRVVGTLMLGGVTLLVLVIAALVTRSALKGTVQQHPGGGPPRAQPGSVMAGSAGGAGCRP